MSGINNNVIQNSSVFTQYKDIANFKLNDQGQIETQSNAKAGLQKFADFFRSWTSSGREAIAARNGNIVSAMRTMIANEQQAAAETAGMSVDKSGDIGAARKLIASLKPDATPQEKSAADNQLKVATQITQTKNTLSHIAQHFTKQVALHAIDTRSSQTKGISEETVTKMKDFIKNGVSLTPEMKSKFEGDFAKLHQETNEVIRESGLPEVFINDAKRGFLESFNGEEVKRSQDSEFYDDLVESVPKECRKFVGLISAQSGFAFACQAFISNVKGGETIDSRMATGMDYLKLDLNLSLSRGSSSIDIGQDGSITITSTGPFDIQDLNDNNMPLTQKQFSAQMVIPNPNQTVDGLPQFEVTKFEVK